jgi:hypothetical protein
MVSHANTFLHVKGLVFSAILGSVHLSNREDQFSVRINRSYYIVAISEFHWTQMIDNKINVLDCMRAAELQRTKAGARIGMDALANPDRYGTGTTKEVIRERSTS